MFLKNLHQFGLPQFAQAGGDSQLRNAQMRNQLTTACFAVTKVGAGNLKQSGGHDDRQVTDPSIFASTTTTTSQHHQTGTRWGVPNI